MNPIPAFRHGRLDELASHPTLPAAAEVALSVAVVVTRWSLRARTRKALKRLDKQRLADIGMTPEEAWREAALPFWRD